MADPLTIVGGVASLAQILDFTVKAGSALRRLGQDIRDAPLDVERLEHKLSVLQTSIEITTKVTDDMSEDDIFPPDLKCLLLRVLEELERDIEALALFTTKFNLRSTLSIRSRIRWGLIEKSTVERLRKRLQETESSLSGVVQLLTLYVDCIGTSHFLIKFTADSHYYRLSPVPIVQDLLFITINPLIITQHKNVG